jgi:hypothetical protein
MVRYGIVSPTVAGPWVQRVPIHAARQVASHHDRLPALITNKDAFVTNVA